MEKPRRFGVGAFFICYQYSKLRSNGRELGMVRNGASLLGIRVGLTSLLLDRGVFAGFFEMEYLRYALVINSNFLVNTREVGWRLNI